MQTSDQIDQVSAAMLVVQGSLKPIQKTKAVKTGKFEFRYAPLDQIMETITPLMQSAGLVVMQAVDSDTLTTRVIHASGQWIQSSTYLNKDHANMQGFGSEVTYRRRYALCSLLGIVSDEDNDVSHISGMDAAHESLAELPKIRQLFLKYLAELIKEKHKEGNKYGAFEEYDALEDQEERSGIWPLLPSDVRRSIKEFGQQARKQANEEKA